MAFRPKAEATNYKVVASGFSRKHPDYRSRSVPNACGLWNVSGPVGCHA
jgi:hypothetical protein